MRVTYLDNNPASDSDGSMDCAAQSDTIDITILEIITDGSMDATSTRPTPRLSRMDLSYMLNWDPSTRRKSEGDKRQTERDTQHQASSIPRCHERLRE
jgi:hypothetical protein